LVTTKATRKAVADESGLDLEYIDELGLSDKLPVWRDIRDEMEAKGEKDE